MSAPSPALPPLWTRLVEGLAAFSALMGGVVLTGLLGVSVASIVPRTLGFQPILGDYELVQVGLAVCVAMFLPWCQIKGGNIIVDFFTARLRARAQRRLDVFGALLFAAMMALVAWRVGAGALALADTGETTMLLEFPLWIAYALMVPGFALTSLAALDTAWKAWAASRRE